MRDKPKSGMKSKVMTKKEDIKQDKKLMKQMDKKPKKVKDCK